MRYLVTLKPLEPFLFGGDMTFGTLGDKEAGSYLVKSRHFPQQTALLGMVRKVLMVQAGLLTRKLKGEWVDKEKKAQAAALVGDEKFNMLSSTRQNIGKIKSISPLFLLKEKKRYIPQADVDTYPYEKGKLGNDYSGKIDIFDNFVSLESNETLKRDDIFQTIEHTGNKKGGEQNSLFKKSMFRLKEGFCFAFYLESDAVLEDDIVSLGADGSAFKLSVMPSDESLPAHTSKPYTALLSDAYLPIDIRAHCEFAITREISHRNLFSKKSALKRHKEDEAYRFAKSKTLYLYEKGSIFFAPDATLQNYLDNENLQQIGYNHYIKGEEK